MAADGADLPTVDICCFHLHRPATDRPRFLKVDAFRCKPSCRRTFAFTTPVLPTQVRSRGGKDCGVCTNGTGGNFARGVGMVVAGGAYNTVQNDKDGCVTYYARGQR